MSEQKITITATPSKAKSVSVSNATIANKITATPDASLYYSNLSKQWAIKMDGLVVGEDYSSKYYAENARIHAETAKMEASTVNGLIPELQENFNNYNSTLNETADNAITEINTNRDYAITQVNTTSTEAVSIVEQTALLAVSDVGTLSGKAVSEINTSKNTALTKITQEAQKQIDNIESTGFYMRDDKLYFINSEGVETEFESGGGSGYALGDIVQKDHILSFEESEGLALLGTYVYKNGVAGSRYGYPDFYDKYIDYKNNSTATETTLGGSTITIYNNANGMKFYDIANKSVIDSWFETTGVAWFYGIDEANERIFLPRNKYLSVTGDVSVAGNGYALGLTNGTTNVGLTDYNPAGWGSGGVFAGRQTNYGSVVGSGGNALSSDLASRASVWGVTDDPTKSGIEGQLTPNENIHFYMVVGNTTTEKAQTEAIEITTSENDTLPLFYNFYSQEDMTTTGAYVNASLGSWLSGNVYTTAYNELVNKLGTGNVKTNTDSYTDYDFVINQDDMTFRLPLLNGSEDLVSNKSINLGSISSGGTVTAPANGYIFAVVPSTAANQVLAFKNNNSGLSSRNYSVASGNDVMCMLPVAKDDVVTVGFGAAYRTLTFYYAQGNGDLYYKVANAVTNLEILDVAKVTADLNTKLSRGNAEEIASWGMPDYSAPIDKAGNQTYLAEVDGYGYIYEAATNNSLAIGGIQISQNSDLSNSIWLTGFYSNASNRNVNAGAFIPKGWYYRFRMQYSSGFYCKFYPLKGANL